MKRIWVYVVVLVWAGTAAAQDTAAGGSAGPPWVVALPALLIAVAAYLRAVVPASKFPAWVAPLFDLVGGNWGGARNDPNNRG